ncbi:TITAN9 [Salix viminalis]|uniref:TITAN9 n=1 Tax=Salix viminalis TaxID=40686 RepID=A0A6N2L4P8_SALVM|nr:TITAN9 [Salix viminalis]
MEDLYRKLYAKYDKLKKKQLSEFDELNKDQEVKFLNYASVAEEMIQYLKDENDRLRNQASDLRSEAASIRSTMDEQCAEYQKLLMEENKKNKMLNEEVEKLQNQLQYAFPCNYKDKNNDNVRFNMLETAQVTPEERSTASMRRMVRKRSLEAREKMEALITHGGNDILGYSDMQEKSAKRSSKGTVSCGDLPNDQKLESHERILNKSAESGPANFQFQALLEYLVGMKLSAVDQNDEVCISALHQSSGYAFTLTWVKKEAEEEPELLYRVITLGTFERVAPEWMRSVLMFSMRMWPIFFERVACVIKLHR